MSFVITQPEALTAAASALQNLGTSMAAEDAAAAAPTTGVASCGRRPGIGAAGRAVLRVRHLVPAGQRPSRDDSPDAGAHPGHQRRFLWGNRSGQPDRDGFNVVVGPSRWADRVWDVLVGTLRGGRGSGAGSSSTGAAIATPFTWFQNVGAAASDFIALGQGQFLPGAVNWEPEWPAAAGAPFMPTAPIGPAAAVGAVGGPVSAGVGQASSLGGLSVPPSWVAAGVPAANSAAATLAGAGWTSAAPHTPPVTTMPAGVPSVASAGRPGYGFGAPRYGVKPTVMPKPTVV